MLKLNKIYNMECTEAMKLIEDNFIDLTVTSPPYDNLRTYNGFSFDFEPIAQELYRITKPGGVVVWVVGDATVKGSETGTSFKQALYLKEIGFNLHDTMIWKKQNPMPVNDKRYQQSFEYMFIFSKGSPKTINLLKVEKTEGTINRQKNKVSTIQKGKYGINNSPTFYKGNDRPTTIKRKNIWEYQIGFNAKNDKFASIHPAPFPEQLAQDHIISWSNQGDLVLDPMCGSGTTCKMAKLSGRNYIGIDISEEYCEIAKKRIENINKGELTCLLTK